MDTTIKYLAFCAGGFAAGVAFYMLYNGISGFIATPAMSAMPANNGGTPPKIKTNDTGVTWPNYWPLNQAMVNAGKASWINR